MEIHTYGYSANNVTTTSVCVSSQLVFATIKRYDPVRWNEIAYCVAEILRALTLSFIIIYDDQGSLSFYWFWIFFTKSLLKFEICCYNSFLSITLATRTSCFQFNICYEEVVTKNETATLVQDVQLHTRW